MKALYLTTLVVLSGIFASASLCRPTLLADNEFIKGFLAHDVLPIMAIIMTIAIASVATIHIWFNELEAKAEKKVFGEARREINHDAQLLIWLFLAEFIFLVIRAYFDGSELAISFFNGAAIVVFLASVVSLIDILNVMRTLTPPS